MAEAASAAGAPRVARLDRRKARTRPPVASVSLPLAIAAATISPFSAIDCSRTTTRSPLAIPAPVIESPATLSMNSLPAPTSLRGSQKVSSTICFREDRNTGRDPPHQWHLYVKAIFSWLRYCLA